ncbi:MAG: recombinase family protein [Oscillospiraceae bacterium]|nr:recombinase family protein [Oscillospiraceae bacterium]
MNNTAIYLRLSSSDENYGESNSIKNQRDLLTMFVANQPDLRETKIIEVCDDGYSGTNFDRPGVKRLLELVKNGEVKCILVKDFSRFGRNYIETCDYIEQIFPSLGVRFISVNDGYDSDKTDMSAGNLNVAFMNLIHDLYAKDISTKIKTAQRVRWEKGEISTPSTIFGYAKSPDDKHKIVIDKPAADIVKQVFNMAANGYGTAEIARFLNANNIPTPGKYKKRADKVNNDSSIFWTNSMVRKIITDEKYTGKAIFGKTRRKAVGSRQILEVNRNEWIIKENAFEAIITEDIFTRAQKKDSRERLPVHKQKEQRIIYGKVRCYNCGRLMDRRTYKNPVYVCETPKFINSPGCVRGHTSERAAAHCLFEMVRIRLEIYSDSENDILKRNEADLSENKRRQISLKIQETRRLLQKLSQNQISLYESYQDKKISREQYSTERETFNSQIESLENQLQLLRSELELTALPKSAPPEQTYMRSVNGTELSRKMVDCLIDGIIAYGADRIKINWKTSDDLTLIEKKR